MTIRVDQNLPKSHKLRKSSDFEYLREGSQKFYRFPLVCYYKTTKIPPGARFGISVSRKLGNAVTRNKLKRQIKEYFRKSLFLKSRPLDLLFVVTKVPEDNHQIFISLQMLEKKLGFPQGTRDD